MFEWIATPEGWLALASVLTLEVMQGVDNIVFIAILAGTLPEHQRARALQLGFAVAAITRLTVLFSVAWIVTLTHPASAEVGKPVFAVMGNGFSWRHLVLIGGGILLLVKAVSEMHNKLEGERGGSRSGVQATFAAVVMQIMILDLVFAVDSTALDSIVAAVGMAPSISMMVAAILGATAIMILLAKAIHSFVRRHPTIRLLAPSFLLLLGVALIADGMGQAVPKSSIYFLMGFLLFVELLHIRLRKVSAAVKLHAIVAPKEAAK